MMNNLFNIMKQLIMIISIMLLLCLLTRMSYYIFSTTNNTTWAKIGLVFGFSDLIIGTLGLILVAFRLFFIKKYFESLICLLAVIVCIIFILLSIMEFLSHKKSPASITSCTSDSLFPNAPVQTGPSAMMASPVSIAASKIGDAPCSFA